MKIGILSDSHDNLPKIEKAVKFFNKNKVDFVLHAGDFVAPFTIPKLKNLKCDWAGVFGNNDGEKNGLMAISKGRIKEGPLRIEIDKRKITIVHDINKINAAEEDAHLIVSGHTHEVKIVKENSKLILNPGECGGWLTGKSTIAMVDLASLLSEVFNL